MSELSQTDNVSGKKVYVAGHLGMVGSALMRRLGQEDCQTVTASRSELDLNNQAAVLAWMHEKRPQTVIIAAAKVGGIVANDRWPVEFLYDNLMIEANLINAAHSIGVGKLLFLGSSCIYPKMAAQPIREEALLTSPLETTNEWYAIAKIAGIKLCQAFRRQHGSHFVSAMPTNLYGPFDNYDLTTSHVMPALMRKIHAAQQNGDPEVVIWGSGTPRREFLHVDDLADAVVFLLKHYDGYDHLNVGCGEDLSIINLAKLIAQIVGYSGRFEMDTSKPDGTPRKLLDSSRLAALGWKPSISLQIGIRDTYQWFLDHHTELKMRSAPSVAEPVHS